MSLHEPQEIENIRPGSLWELKTEGVQICAFKLDTVKGPANSELDYYAFKGYTIIKPYETIFLCLGIEKLWVNSTHTLHNLKATDAAFGLSYNYEKLTLIKGLVFEEIVYITFTNYQHFWKKFKYMVEITGNNLV
ncbi:MAG: hypothetical protein WC761_01950 [Candidatus Paceibacterota bacterium]|jgi:hypothetical protein